MSDIVNALVFTSIKNNIPITDPRFQRIQSSSNFIGLGDVDRDTRLDEILSDTTIKRACCLGKAGKDGNITADEKHYKIKVKIPIPSDYSPNVIERKFGYINKEVLVPIEQCKSVLPLFDSSGDGFLSSQCDPFYNTYCENMKYLYKLENRDPSGSPQEFYEFASDCACHQDVNPIYPPGFSRSCSLDFCQFENRPSVYLDATTRDNLCEGTFCTAITNIGAIQLSGSSNLNISNKVLQKCGPGTTINQDPSGSLTVTPVGVGGPVAGPGAGPGAGAGAGAGPGSKTPPTTPPTTPSTNLSPLTENKFAIGGVILFCCCIIIIIIILLGRKK
jgi:hypothetical protein